MGRLDGKVTIVAGATSGIGLRTAEVFAAEGASVVVSGRREAEGSAIAQTLGDNAIFVPADVADEAQVKALIDQTVDRYGRVDCLFNNAGIPGREGGIEDVTSEQLENEMGVLVNGVIYGMKHAAPIMKRQGSGSIINTGSIAGQRAGFSPSLIYGVAKAAVIHASQCVAMELAEHGVRVNSLSPGAIVTGIFGKAFGVDDNRADATSPELLDRFAQAQAVLRAGIPDDIAQAALFLASDESTFVTATDILVDGGMIAGRRWSEQKARWQGLSETVNTVAAE